MEASAKYFEKIYLIWPKYSTSYGRFPFDPEMADNELPQFTQMMAECAWCGIGVFTPIKNTGYPLHDRCREACRKLCKASEGKANDYGKLE